MNCVVCKRWLPIEQAFYVGTVQRGTVWDVCEPCADAQLISNAIELMALEQIVCMR